MDSQAQSVPGTEPADIPFLRNSVSAIERLIEDGICLAERLQQSGYVPDLEKCSLAAARAADCLAGANPHDQQHVLHELRNHLGAVSGYVELLLEEHADDPTPQLQTHLEALQSGVTSLLEQQSGIAPPTAGMEIDGGFAVALPSSDAGTLLVIDDSEQNRELLARYLQRQGHQVLTAASGAEALRIMRETHIDLVFLDLVMPEMSGLELLRLIKSDAALRAVPVIIVSGASETERVIRCIEAGAEDYLHKPFNPTLLQARLNAGMQRKRWHDREEAYRRELERNQRFIRNTFGRYLSDEIVDALLATPQGLKLGGITCRVTILMADIRNFSVICENHAPEQVVTLLNNYLGVMSGIVMANNGTVDEFIGDAILAIFGAPIQREDDALRAVTCALQMQHAVHDINARNLTHGLPAIGIGIGLNSGVVVAGNIGSEQRSKYAVVGHTVNLTGRIESYTSGGEILAARSTIDELGEAVQTGHSFTVKPKGMAEEVTVYSITGLNGENQALLPSAPAAGEQT